MSERSGRQPVTSGDGSDGLADQQMTTPPLTTEVRSRLVGQVADALIGNADDSDRANAVAHLAARRIAEVAVRTVCALIAAEIDDLHDAMKDEGGSQMYLRGLSRAAALVASLALP